MRRLALLFVALGAFGLIARAQEAPKAPAAANATASEPAEHYYKLDFVVQEVGANGKPVNSRSYSETVVADQPHPEASIIRTGARVPVATGVGTQFNYLDAGVNIQVSNAHAVGRQLSIHVNADVNSLVFADSSAEKGQPVIRQNSWIGPVLLQPGKTKVAFSSDVTESKGSMQLAVTATLIQ